MNIIAVLITLSSILYGAAFVFHQYFWWFIFLFPVPLFYVYRSYQFSALWGWWWSFLGTLLHMIGIIYSTIIIAQGPWYQAIIMAPIAITLNGLAAIPFFYIMNSLHKKYILQNSFGAIILFSANLSGYFYLAERAILCIYDRCEGYMLLNPLVLLAKHPLFLKFLPNIGSFGYLFIFFGIIAGITNNVLNYLLLGPTGLLQLCTTTDKWGWKGRNLAVLCALLLIGSLIIHIPHNQIIKLPEWYNQTVVIQHVFHKTPYLNHLADTSRILFANAQEQYPDATLFLMPESSFYSDHIDKEIIHNAWSTQYLKKELTIVTGAFRWDEDKHRNTLFFIRNGKIIDLFDKRHAMLLTERPMHFFNYQMIHDLYFKNYHEIIPSSNPRPEWKLLDSLTVTPYICSELFFNYHPDDNSNHCPILASCNDRWVPSYMKGLMMYAVIKQAIQWKREIIYINFTHAFFITPNGVSIPLQTYQTILK